MFWSAAIALVAATVPSKLRATGRGAPGQRPSTRAAPPATWRSGTSTTALAPARCSRSPAAGELLPLLVILSASPAGNRHARPFDGSGSPERLRRRRRRTNAAATVMKIGAAAGRFVSPSEHRQPLQPAADSPHRLMRPKRCFWQELIVVWTPHRPVVRDLGVIEVGADLVEHEAFADEGVLPAGQISGMLDEVAERRLWLEDVAWLPAHGLGLAGVADRRAPRRSASPWRSARRCSSW